VICELKVRILDTALDEQHASMNTAVVAMVVTPNKESGNA